MAMPIAWQAGYDWAYDKGDYAQMDCGDAAEAHGWDFASKEYYQFMVGVYAAQREQNEELSA